MRTMGINGNDGSKTRLRVQSCGRKMRQASQQRPMKVENMDVIPRAGGVLRSTWNRIYADFLLPTRLDLYSDLLRKAVDCGYHSHSILSFWQSLKNGGLSPNRKYLILRHDIDNLDIHTTQLFWQIERALGLTSTFYFRLSTLVPTLMNEIHLSGFEVSYHYEELAKVAKERGLTRPEQVFSALPEIRLRFWQAGKRATFMPTPDHPLRIFTECYKRSLS